MSIVDSIRSAAVPVHPEGYKFIAAFLAATILLGFLWGPLFWIGLGLTIWCALFFRDPERVTPVDDDLIVSPADGRISHIAKVVPPAGMGLGDEPLTRVSVFMNVFNCHVNRVPVRGRIRRIAYTSGKFFNAELDKASAENERNSLLIDGPHGEVGVVQIAGLVARRILCFATEGEEMAAGERFGLIRFGSRLDVYLPEGAEVAVAIGQTAIAGETVIARHGPGVFPPVTRRS